LDLLENYKKKRNITKIESNLSVFSGKSCILDKFKSYIQYKNMINDILRSDYENTYFRKYKWYSYINTKRSEDNLVNSIKKTYGDDITMIYGDWDIGYQLRNFISTPMIGLKRKLSEHFKIYNIDEFRTSCLHYKTESKCENLYLPTENSVSKKLHSVLTYQMENQRYGCVNRDVNAVKNMRKIANHWLQTGERLLAYSRESKINVKRPTTINPVNPVSNNSVPEVRLSLSNQSTQPKKSQSTKIIKELSKQSKSKTGKKLKVMTIED
jgi:hypothetical protein